MVIQTDKGKFEENLNRVLMLVRGRYIVEFPRTDTAEAGLHGFAVNIGNGDLFIRPSGKSVPLPDPEVLADPSMQAKDPSKAPRLGHRKVPTVKPQP
jgi:hypothetical protein